MVADSWDIDERKCTRRGTRTGYATRGGFGGFASKPSVAGFPGLRLKTRAEVLVRTDGTWRHRGDRVEARLPVRRRGGRRIKRKLESDQYALSYVVWLICIKSKKGM